MLKDKDIQIGKEFYMVRRAQKDIVKRTITSVERRETKNKNKTKSRVIGFSCNSDGGPTIWEAVFFDRAFASLKEAQAMAAKLRKADLKYYLGEAKGLKKKQAACQEKIKLCLKENT
jgi:hypothetical protein